MSYNLYKSSFSDRQIVLDCNEIPRDDIEVTLDLKLVLHC